MSTKEHRQPGKIVIFASGSGTNAENIIRYSQNSGNMEVAAVLSNRRSAPVLKRAHDLKVKALHFDKESLYHSFDVLRILKDMNPDLIVLAGFLWIFPEDILAKFENKVINIHPALLPNYGGKGMYGMRVHKEVIKNNEKESGITIHYVNKEYDKGEIIFQAKTPISEKDTPETLAEKIHSLEYEHFPKVIEQLLENNTK